MPPRSLSIDTQVKPVRSGAGLQRAPMDLTPGLFTANQQATASIVSDLGSIAKDLRAATIEADTTNVIKAEAKYKEIVATQINKLDRLDPDYQSRVDEITQAAQKEVTDGTSLRTREASSELEARLARTRGDVKINTLAAQRKSIQEEAVRVYDVSYNAVGQDIRKNPDQMEAILARWKPDSDRLLAGVDTDIRGRLEFKLKSDSIALQALGYADRGMYGKAKEIVDANAGSLDRAQEQKVTYQIEQIKNRHQADANKYAANVSADISAKLHDWAANPNPEAEPPVSRQQLQNMRDRGLFNGAPERYAALVNQLYGAETHRKSAMGTTMKAMQAYHTNTITGPEQADLAWNYINNGTTGKDKVPVDPANEDMLGKAVKFAQDTGFIPPTYRNFINNVSSSAGPGDQSGTAQAKLATAVQMYDKFVNAAPNIKWGGAADDKDAPVATAHQIMREENISAMEAARRALALTPKDREVATLRVKDFNEELKKLRGLKNVNDYLGEEIKSQYRTVFSLGAEGYLPFTGSLTISAEAIDAYRRRYEQAFVSTGDMKTARGVANEYLRNNFRITGMGADKDSVVQYAPENFIPPTYSGAIPQEVVSEMFTTEIQKKLKEAGMDADPAKWRLRADSQTADEARAFMSNGGGAVSYRLQVQDTYGNFVDVNGPRWRVPTAEEIAADPVFQSMRNKQRTEFETRQEGATEAAKARAIFEERRRKK
jgi:hypothetical protein